MKCIFFLLFVFFPMLCLGQFSFEYAIDIPVTAGEKFLDNPWAGGLNAPQYGTLDINGDNVPDLAIFDRTSNKLNTFLYLNGKYVYSPEYEALFPDDLDAWVVFADYNCDGKKDLFTNAPFGMKLYQQVTATEGNLEWELVANPINTEGSSGPVNLQVNSSDIPGIVDVDSDGDLDILVFNFASGGNIEYHQNMAIENGGSCGALVFKQVKRSWGNFTECSCGVYAFGDNTCTHIDHSNRNNIHSQERIQHAGGKAILLLDYNGDGIKDLVFSDELCQNLVLMENSGNNENALFTDFDSTFPNTANPASFFTFPAAYYEDVDRDGLKDLLVAPNVFKNILHKIDFIHSSWWYRNTGTKGHPAFELVQKDFLQGEMIEVGENARPLFGDYEGDGDLDLFIANKGSLINNGYYSTIQLWENIGSAIAPSFQLLQQDFLSISSLKFTDLKPSFADLNGDGYPDLVFSAVQGNSQKLYGLINTSSGRGLELQGSELRELSVSLSIGDTPLAHDVNKDGLADLIIAKARGRLEYYVGTEAISFQLKNPSLAGFENEFANQGITPAIGDLNNDGKEELVISNSKGELQIIEGFMKATDPKAGINEILSLTVTDRQVTTRFGQHAWPTIADLYGTGFPALFIGSAQGGVIPLRNRSESKDTGESELRVNLFPNPAGTTLYVRSVQDITIEIFTILGQCIMDKTRVKPNTKHTIDISAYRSGVYLLRARATTGSTMQRFIVQ